MPYHYFNALQNRVRTDQKTVRLQLKNSEWLLSRDGMEYEFTAVFDLSLEHVVSISKDRTGLFGGHYFKPDVMTEGQMKIY